MNKIVVENLYKKINRFTLSGVSFAVHDGEIFAIVGMTGSGKSTVTKILQNLSYQDSGKIYFDKSSYGMLVQEQEFYKNKTIFQTMLLYSKMYPQYISRSDIRNVLRIVGLYKKRYVKIKHLNVSRHARLKIALSIMRKPKVLILDDPFAFLSEYEARQIRIILRTLSDKFKTAILLTANDFSGIEEIFDTVAIIEGGEIVCIHTYNDLAKMTDKESKICISTPSPNLVATEIQEKFKYETRLYNESDVIVNAHPDKAQEICDYLYDKDIPVIETTRVNKSIQSLFHSLRTRTGEIS